MKKRFYTMHEICDGFKDINDEIANIFFNGETHAEITNLEMKNITSFDDTTVYIHYELTVGYKRPIFKFPLNRVV